jgi:hypothetical protein
MPPPRLASLKCAAKVRRAPEVGSLVRSLLRSGRRRCRRGQRQVEELERLRSLWLPRAIGRVQGDRFAAPRPRIRPGTDRSASVAMKLGFRIRPGTDGFASVVMKLGLRIRPGTDSLASAVHEITSVHGVGRVLVMRAAAQGNPVHRVLARSREAIEMVELEAARFCAAPACFAHEGAAPAVSLIDFPLHRVRDVAAPRGGSRSPCAIATMVDFQPRKPPMERDLSSPRRRSRFRRFYCVRSGMRLRTSPFCCHVSSAGIH